MTGHRRVPALAMLAALAVVSGLAACQSAPAGLDFETYRAEVEPILLLDRGGYGPGASACVTCHVESGTPMRLQALEEDGAGGVFWTEAQSRMNFEVVARLVTPGVPGESRLLRAPLAEEAGGIDFHTGGTFWESQDDPEWQTLAAWVGAADAVPAASAAAMPDFAFFQQCVQLIFLDREQESDRMECAACHGAPGIREFARELPEGRDFWTEEESRENYEVLMRFVEPGFPLGSRFLTHPLSPEAGGDNYHSGGRRWQSQDDPEWQMLSAWVQGETPACVVSDR